MNVVRLIASRYVWPRRLSVISIIGGISVVGITIGTAALIIVMSLFNGFRQVAYDLMIGFGPHLQIVASEGAVLPDSDHALAVLQSVELRAVSRSTASRMVVMAGSATGVVDAVGVDADTLGTLEGPRTSVFVGTFATQPHLDVASITIASGVAEQLGLYVGDTVRLLAPRTIERAVRTLSMPDGVPAVVRGIFQSNAARDVDQSRVYVAAATVQQLTGLQHPTSIDALLADPHHASELVPALQERLGSAYHVRTWADVNRGLVDTMELERLGSFIVLLLIIIVAAFNVVVALTLGVVEKRRDIGVLLTLGLRPSDVQAMYIRQGLALGIVAVAVGVLIGVGISWGQMTFHWIAFDMQQGYLVPALPMDVHVLDVLIVAGVGIVLAAGAAVYPARMAARMQISDAIRVD